MVYRFGDFGVDDVDFRLTCGTAPVALEPKALRLLIYLVQNPGRLVRKQELLDAVWAEASVSENALARSIGLLRRALDDRSREPRYIETVPTEGYRFIAAVVAVDRAAAMASIPAEGSVAAVQPEAVPEQQVVVGTDAVAGGEGGPATGLPKPRWRGPVLTLVLALVLVALLGVGWAVWAHVRRGPAIHSIAVLPLENLSGDPAQAYFADGTTDELITELARIPNLRVVSRTSVMYEKSANKSLQQIASDLDVDAIVEGSIVRSGDRVRITVQLIDTHSDRHLWAQSFEGSSADLLSLQDSVADQIAAEARAVLVPRDQDATQAVPFAAQDDYLRGRFFFQKDDFIQSAESFRVAIASDPAYASAYAGLADALDAQTTFGEANPQEAMPLAVAAAQHALQLDPNNGEAYEALGSIQTIYLWNWREAERNLTRAIALRPSYALAEMKYAVLLDAIGKPDEAVEHMRRAVSLDPLSFFMNRLLGTTLYLARRYDEAYAQFQRAAELEPEHTSAVDFYKAKIYALKGDRDKNVDYDLRLLHSEWDDLDVKALRTAYRRDGWNGYLRARIQALQPHADKGCVPYEIGVNYSELGNRDLAFKGLNSALDHHCYAMAWTEVDPMLDGLRGDPRYTLLLRRLNLAA